MNDFNYDELYKKYQVLVEENNRLKSRIEELEGSSGSIKSRLKTFQTQEMLFKETPQNDPENDPNKDQGKPLEKNLSEARTDPDIVSSKVINQYSPKEEKIALFMSLFKGRSDVYAKRWQNKKGKSGYSPVCLNEWLPGVCQKPKIKCSKCRHKRYAKFYETVVEEHLRGDTVIGIYPMNLDETCYFLSIDFDDEGWEKDIAVVWDTCTTFGIPVAVERSRSGAGGHIWFFFKEKISAVIARKFGTSLLTYAMGKRHEISFTSYDRLFPNQDTMPKGGFGNLIALPLQKSARKKDNSIFLDKKFVPHVDQWNFLSDIQKLAEAEVVSYTAKLSKGNELGMLKSEDSDENKPWIKKRIELQHLDFPETVEIVVSGMLYVKKTGLSPKALNVLKRLAAFKNPEFYKNQAMRLPTFNKPRVISCSEDFEDYLVLPRGCEEDIYHLLKEFKVKYRRIDETNHGRSINVEFNGVLKKEQSDAVDALLEKDNGVLAAATAFGKTVVGAKLISSRKVNTLILVHRQQLLSQWVERLSEFLLIHEALPELLTKSGRKKKQNLIGQLGAGKNRLNSIVDVAIMQSLNSGGDVKACIKNYGMIIVDECHHVPAFSFEQILKNATAKYVYGLTATPSRPDGHHPIIFFYCGPIRHTVDAKVQAEKRPFEHYLIPRFTSFRIGGTDNTEALTIQEIYSKLIEDQIRNELIIDDVVECHKNGRNSLVLTGRLAHVNSLSDSLKRKIPNVISLTGGMGTKKTAEVLQKITSIPGNRPFVLVATGSFIGEGFDESRLDTLFLAMPVAWKGTLQQYAGRLHRLHKKKKDVQIYDYIDIHERMLENMYGKRLKGYSAIGYKAKVENISDSPTDIIFDEQSFFPVYLNDIENASKHVLIVSPFVTKKRVIQMMGYFENILKKQVKITVVTRPVNDFTETQKRTLEKIFSLLTDAGVNIVFKSKIHQKFVVIDGKIIWYGSINLLSFGHAKESIMRLLSGNISYELTKNI
jgi:superfamily II DNA or RNA helicase